MMAAGFPGHAEGDGQVATLTEGMQEELLASYDQPISFSAPFCLTQILEDAGLLSKQQLETAQETARREKLPLARIVVRDGYMISRDLATLTSLQLSLPMVDLRSQSIEPEATKLLPEDLARRYVALPISKDESFLTVAVIDPTDLQLIQDLAARTESSICPVIATFEDILEHIDISYRLTESMDSASSTSGGIGTGAQSVALRDAPPSQIIDLLVHQALHDRASDIHIEPTETLLRIRFRIDGILHETITLPLELHPTLISRIKVMSGMNIAERRRPQDGQFSVEASDRKADVRVAISNTVNGELAVLRLLDKGFTLLGLGQLGMGDYALDQLRKLLRLPYGMIVVCGPTGAGKSTTLYASVLQMDRTERKIVSLEDPVEYRISNINQMQVHADAGITFASQLRSCLRLDPDIIMVGEIRDQETAVVATQAALTGHLVLTSLHANDAVSALLRLKDLGVAQYLVTSALSGVVAQRMVRMVCNGCRAAVRRPQTESEAYQSEVGESLDRFTYGSGCNMCAQTGYLGRTGVFEVMTMSDEIRQLFLDEAPRSKLLEVAREEGMVHLRRDGMLKVKEGATTPYEVMRVLFSLEA